MWRAITLRIGIYSRLPRTRTLANSNLALTRAKINFPWISFIQYSVTRTLENSNIPVTRGRSNFCLPTNDFYFILPSITRTMFQSVTSRKKNVYNETLNLFQNCRVFFVCTSLSILFKCSVQPWSWIFNTQVFCCPWSEMNIAWYLHSFLNHMFISLF